MHTYIHTYIHVHSYCLRRGHSISVSLLLLQPLHIVLVPFTTAFYNIAALMGIFPALEVVEKKLPHHLRCEAYHATFHLTVRMCDTFVVFICMYVLAIDIVVFFHSHCCWILIIYCRFHETSAQDSQAAENAQAAAKVDLVAERRRLKAMKVSAKNNRVVRHIDSRV